ncbi:MFS transporter [Mesorhizobium sp. L-8-3]|uniref:MFS transporter n=1 Tax=Mesorhizobium sp. L-8-3 TaxID=2744522 RepID=UPI00192759E7|nr:MFS transporter [Mesorhizobium sp. L-8-3]BCH26482.1 hypothetical protein MesoLjLb_62670 [Mesorhizobium sp. L-8-3]
MSAAVGSLGTFVLAPTAQAMIELWSWQGALGGLAALALCMAAVAFVFRAGAPDGGEGATGEKSDARGAIREALADQAFVVTTVSFFACGFQLIFIATHLPKYIGICGLPPSVSAQAIALIGICNAVGTLVAGYVCQRWGKKNVLALIYLLRTASVALFFALPVSAETALVFAAAMGFLWLSVVPPISGLINSRFGAANFGTLFGVMFLTHQLGAFLGAWLGGLTYQWSGSYSTAWISLIVVGALAAMLQFMADDETPRRTQAA